MVLRLWSKEDPFGTEFVDITFGNNTLAAVGVAIGTFTPKEGTAKERMPYRVDYKLTTVEKYVTSRLVIRSQGEGWYRALDLRRLAGGAWKCTTESGGDLELPPPGGDLSALNDAADCDIASSPLTNTTPVLRHRLHEGGTDPVELAVAWVSLPDLSVRRERQRYGFIRTTDDARVVRFDALDDPFTAELVMDDQGLVIDYPGIARRVK